MGTRLDRCHNVADVRRLALPRLPLPVREFLEGGAEDEVTLRRNTAAFDDLALHPRTLIDVSEIDLSTSIFGREISMPVIIAPTGATGTFHPDAEIAVARAAAEAGTLYGLSTSSTRTIEEVGAATAGPKMFQLYVFNDRGVSREMIERSRAAGFDALCLTVDNQVNANRERDVRTGIAEGASLSLRSTLSVLTQLRWLVNNARAWRRAGQFHPPRARPARCAARCTHRREGREASGRGISEPGDDVGGCRGAGKPLERPVRGQGRHDGRGRARGRRHRG